MTEVLAEQLETEESMFVQTAAGMDSDGGTLTLRGITPSTLYFSDRPQRVVGHMTTADFVDLWAIGDNSFESDPPNAVLAFLEPGADVPDDAVVVHQGAEPRRRRRSRVFHRGARGNGSGAHGAGHAVHRPVRPAAVARVGVRHAQARTAAGPPLVREFRMRRRSAAAGRRQREAEAPRGCQDGRVTTAEHRPHRPMRPLGSAL